MMLMQGSQHWWHQPSAHATSKTAISTFRREKYYTPSRQHFKKTRMPRQLAFANQAFGSAVDQIVH
jgi:hypothetical protein